MSRALPSVECARIGIHTLACAGLHTLNLESAGLHTLNLESAGLHTLNLESADIHTPNPVGAGLAREGVLEGAKSFAGKPCSYKVRVNLHHQRCTPPARQA